MGLAQSVAERQQLEALGSNGWCRVGILSYRPPELPTSQLFFATANFLNRSR